MPQQHVKCDCNASFRNVTKHTIETRGTDKLCVHHYIPVLTCIVYLPCHNTFFFFFFSFLARTDVGTIQKMELWEIKHTRGSANTIHQEVTLVNNGRQVFYRSGFIHSNCFNSFSTLLLFRENTPKHTHTETSFIRTRFQNVESETFFLGTWIKGPKRRQSRLDGVVHFFVRHSAKVYSGNHAPL